MKRAGFTLMEIMIVVVIIMLLMSIAIPRMGGTFTSSQLKASARDVTGLLRYARDYAVVTGRQCEMRLAPDRDAYQIVALDEKGEPLDPRRDRSRDGKAARMMLGDDASSVINLPRRIHFSIVYSEAPLTDRGLPRVVYYPDGSATPAMITIQDEKHHALSVQVFRTTGMARVTTGRPVEEPKIPRRYYGPDKS
jgi:type II secretion system protein H